MRVSLRQFCAARSLKAAKKKIDGAGRTQQLLPSKPPPAQSHLSLSPSQMGAGKKEKTIDIFLLLRWSDLKLVKVKSITQAGDILNCVWNNNWGVASPENFPFAPEHRVSAASGWQLPPPAWAAPSGGRLRKVSSACVCYTSLVPHLLTVFQFPFPPFSFHSLLVAVSKKHVPFFFFIIIKGGNEIGDFSVLSNNVVTTHRPAQKKQVRYGTKRNMTSNRFRLLFFIGFIHH